MVSEKIYGEYPEEARVLKKTRKMSLFRDQQPFRVIFKQLSVTAPTTHYYLMRGLAVKYPPDDRRDYLVFYLDRAGRLQSSAKSEDRVTPVVEENPPRFLGHKSFPSVKGLKLTSFGEDWFAVMGDIPGVRLGDLIEWPALEHVFPELLSIPVTNEVAHDGSKSVLLGGYEDGKLLPDTRITLDLYHRENFSPKSLLRSLVHEVQHLLQTLREDKVPWTRSLPGEAGYEDSPYEAEARAASRRVNPDLVARRGKVKADGIPFAEADWKLIDDENTIITGPLPPLFDLPNTFMIYVAKNPASVRALIDVITGKDTKHTIPLFGYRRDFMGPGTIDQLWRTAFAKRHVIGAAKFTVEENRVIVTHMAVKKAFRRNRINTFMLEKLQEEYPGKAIQFHELTEEGRGFMEAWGRGEEYAPNPLTPEDLELPFAMDREGIGGVPHQLTMDYHGFTVVMTTDRFLHLVPPRFSRSGIEYFKEALQEGIPIAPPFLSVEWMPAGHGLPGAWQVMSHEGRGRVTAIEELYGPQRIPVDILPRGMRARDLTPEMRKAFFVPQERER